MLRRTLMALNSSTIKSLNQSAAVHLERTAGSLRHQDIYHAVVDAIEELSPSVRGLTLRLDAKESAYFYAGQWIDLFIPSVDVVGGFSVHSPPHVLACNQRIQLAVKQSPFNHPPAEWIHSQEDGVGILAEPSQTEPFIHKCKEGDRVQLRFGGDFLFDPVRDKDSSLLLIAGGVGINPLKSILEEALWYNPQRSVHLLYSAKVPEELLFRKRLEELAKEHCHFQLRHFLTDLEPSEDSSRIDQSTLAQSLTEVPERPKCFICGPPPMIDEVSTLLTACDVPAANIFFEKWW